MTITIVMAIIFWMITALISGFGAYFGSYFRKKGENLATHEDIKKLVDQMSAVTTATKEIESKISGDLWDRQKQWELKRDALFEAIKAVGSSMEAVTAVYSVYKLQCVSSEEWKQKTNEAWRSFGEAISRFDQAVSVAGLICSMEVQQLLFNWGLSLRSIVRDLGEGNVTVYEKAGMELAAKRTVINLALRRELGVGFTSLSSESSATPNPVPPNRSTKS